MGEVYRARDARLGRTVAIKVLPAGLSENSGRLERFATEARAASALSHPNIVTVLDVGTSDGTSWIAIEHVEGDTLRRLLGDGPLPLKRVLAVSAQVADGLEGPWHGDRKILDFGLAKLIEPTGENGNERVRRVWSRGGFAVTMAQDATAHFALDRTGAGESGYGSTA